MIWLNMMKYLNQWLFIYFPIFDTYPLVIKSGWQILQINSRFSSTATQWRHESGLRFPLPKIRACGHVSFSWLAVHCAHLEKWWSSDGVRQWVSDDIPYIMENKQCSKPPSSFLFTASRLKPSELTPNRHLRYHVPWLCRAMPTSSMSPGTPGTLKDCPRCPTMSCRC